MCAPRMCLSLDDELGPHRVNVQPVQPARLSLTNALDGVPQPVPVQAQAE